jgi:hypothetical protein
MVFSDLIGNEIFCETEYPLLKLMCFENKDRLINHNARKRNMKNQIFLSIGAKVGLSDIMPIILAK